MAKKKKSRTRSGPRFAWLRTLDWPTIRRGLMAFAWLAGIAGIAAAGWYGVPRLEAHALESSRPQAIELHFVDVPAWAQGDLEARLVRSVEPLLSTNILSRRELMDVHVELLNSGWFERIDQVRRVRADRIEIHGEFVDPYAVVRDRDGDHLIDTRGRLLPTGWSDRFIIITGARFDRPARPGVQWEGADITAALRLLRLIDPQPWRDQVAAINISSHLEGGPIRIVTDRGSRIIWGSPPGEESALEALADRKLYYLTYLHSNYGHIDMGHSGEIDITSTTTVDQRD